MYANVLYLRFAVRDAKPPLAVLFLEAPVGNSPSNPSRVREQTRRKAREKGKVAVLQASPYIVKRW